MFGKFNKINLIFLPFCSAASLQHDNNNMYKTQQIADHIRTVQEIKKILKCCVCKNEHVKYNILNCKLHVMQNLTQLN